MTKNKVLLLGILLLAVTLIGFSLYSSNNSNDNDPNSIPQSPTSDNQETTALPIVLGDKPVEDFQGLLDFLEANGIKLQRLKGPFGPPFFSVVGNSAGLIEEDLHNVPPLTLHGFDYATPEDATFDASKIPSDGKILDPDILEFRSGILGYRGTPHFYKKDNLILLFMGDPAVSFSGSVETSRITRLLESALGPPWVIGITMPETTFHTIFSDPITLTSDRTFRIDYKFRDNGFIIGADNITLDLNGHSIIGLGIGDGILLEGRRGVTIKNAHITHFTNAIRLSDSDDNVILNNQLTGGLVISGNRNDISETDMESAGPGRGNQTTFLNLIGVKVSGSNNKIWNNDFVSVGEFVLEVHGDDNYIRGNTVVGGIVGGTLLHLDGDRNRIIRNFFASSSSIEGVTATYITGQANVFSDNTITGSQGGLILEGASQSIVSGNSIIIAQGNGIEDAGILIKSSHSNKILKNTVAMDNSPGIAIIGSTQNEVLGNSILGRPGLIIEADGNNITDNSIGFHSGYGRYNTKGIAFTLAGDRNQVRGNTIFDTLFITEGEGNVIVENNFVPVKGRFTPLQDRSHARDDGLNNIWHRDGKGNYWAGIFDNPYRIPGTAQSFDRFPVRTPY